MRRNAIVLALLGTAVLAVALVSWTRFPAWRQTPGGALLLVAASAAGVVALVKGLVDILKGVCELTEEQDEPTPPPPVHVETPVHVHVEVPPQAATPAPPHRLPYRLPSDLADFTGREGETQQIVEALGRGGAAISGIGGMGGVGKTALAVHAAYQVAGRFPDAQLLVELRGSTGRPLTPAQAMARVIHALEPALRLPDDEQAVAAVYRGLLRGRRALILLDDAASAAQVRPLVPPEGCGLIVTSRRRFNLPGLSRIDLDALPQGEARELLIRIVGIGRASADELDQVARLCGRLPLALRAAGDFLKLHPDWTAAEYIEALSDERERLKRLKVEDLDVEAALGLSARLLAAERPALAARWQTLSVFPARFDRAAAAAVWEMAEEAARDDLGELLDRSLLLYDGEAQAYHLHDLMRPVARNAFAYGGGARDEAAEGRRLAEAEGRHAAYYLELAARAGALYKEGGEWVLEGLHRFDAAWAHLEAAWGRMQARGGEEADRWLNDLAGRVVYVLALRLAPRERIPLLEQALAAARRLGDRRGEGNHLGNLGLAYAALGEARRAVEYHQQALAISREIGDRQGEGQSLGNLGNAHLVLGEARRAVEYHQQALSISREIGDRRGEGNHLGNLGAAYADLGEARRAVEYYQQALTIAREIGDRRGEGIRLGNLGVAYADLGEADRARELWEQALAIFEAIEDPNAERVRGWIESLKH